MNLISVGYILMFSTPILYLIKYGKGFYEKKIKIFLVYICLIAFVELISLCYGKFIDPSREFTNLIYNALAFFEYNLIFLFYKDISNERVTNIYLKYALILFNIGYVISVFYYRGNILIKYMNYILVYGAFLVSIVFILYLREFLLSDKILKYQKDITFWITVGFLLYYVGTLPFATVFEFVNVNFNVFQIQVMLTIIMHSCFIIGVLKCWKKNI